MNALKVSIEAAIVNEAIVAAATCATTNVNKEYDVVIGKCEAVAARAKEQCLADAKAGYRRK